LDGTVDVYRIFGVPFMVRIRKGLTLNQLIEWEAYDRLDPIGTWRDDFRIAALDTIVTNLAIDIHGKKGSKHKEISDFMPDWSGEGKVKKMQSVEEMKEFLLGFAKKQNKRIGIQSKKVTPNKTKRNG